MIITVSYRVLCNEYDNPDAKHQVSLITTEFTYNNDVLVYLQIGKNLNIRLNNRLRFELQKDMTIHNEQFFAKKKYHTGDAKPVTRSTFEEKKKRFDMSQTAVEREILEDFAYVNRNGKPCEVQIIITAKGESMTAVIDFEDIEQYKSFTPPLWLVPLTE